MGLVKAVDGVTFEVDSRQAVGLVGETGAGKSMTALSIMRLIPEGGQIVHGEIIFKGRNLLQLKDEEMRRIRGGEIGMVFQDPLTYLNPLFSVGDQITESIMIHSDINKRDAKKKAVDVLEQIGIPNASETVNYYPHQLSGGMRQRVLIAIAVSSNPSLLIADEPTTALDVTIQAQVLELIKDLNQRLDLSLLLITHDLGIVAEVCDEVNVMYAGRVVEHAEVSALYDEPLHPYTVALLGSVLSIDEFKETLIAIGGTVPDPTQFPPGCRFHPRCSKATAICRREHPPMFEVRQGREVSCWLYGEPQP
jgi:oligopeptide/dipeptide ABC transporter ATP-binding protein